MIEVVNGLQPKRHNYLAQIIAREMGVPGIAGGDNHQPKMIGRCFTYVEGTTEDEILEYLRQVKKTPTKYRVETYGSGSSPQIWAGWFFYLFLNLQHNIRYDIYRHLNPHALKNSVNPVYDKLYYDMPMFPKILLQAALPYIFWALLAGLKIWVPRVEKQTTKRELPILKSLIDYQGLNENMKIPPLKAPFTEEDAELFQRL
jgi:hypothetical protein